MIPSWIRKFWFQMGNELSFKTIKILLKQQLSIIKFPNCIEWFVWKEMNDQSPQDERETDKKRKANKTYHFEIRSYPPNNSNLKDNLNNQVKWATPLEDNLGRTKKKH
jgi:hypothetical protein